MFFYSLYNYFFIYISINLKLPSEPAVAACISMSRCISAAACLSHRTRLVLADPQVCAQSLRSCRNWSNSVQSLKSFRALCAGWEGKCCCYCCSSVAPNICVCVCVGGGGQTLVTYYYLTMNFTTVGNWSQGQWIKWDLWLVKCQCDPGTEPNPLVCAIQVCERHGNTRRLALFSLITREHCRYLSLCDFSTSSGPFIEKHQKAHEFLPNPWINNIPIF